MRTNISVAYPLGQLGNFFVYLFVVFALFYHGVVAEPFQLSLLPLISLLSGVGSPTSSVDAVSFLSQWLGLPNQTTSLYVSLMTLTRYGQVIASVAGFAFLSFGVVLAYYGKFVCSGTGSLPVFWWRFSLSLPLCLSPADLTSGF